MYASERQTKGLSYVELAGIPQDRRRPSGTRIAAEAGVHIERTRSQAKMDPYKQIVDEVGLEKRRIRRSES